MFIREAKDTDLEEIAHLEAICAGSDGATLNEFKEFYAAKTHGEFLQVLDDNQRLTGFVGYTHNTDEQELYIWNLGIGPEDRRKGFARTLMDHVMRVGQTLKVKKFSLKIPETNEPALVLFKSFGFQQIARINQHNADGSASLVFQLKL